MFQEISFSHYFSCCEVDGRDKRYVMKIEARRLTFAVIQKKKNQGKSSEGCEGTEWFRDDIGNAIPACWSRKAGGLISRGC